MVNGNKGFISLSLMLLFLNAGLSRFFVFSLPSIHKAIEAPHYGSDASNETTSKHLLSALDESDVGFIDQLKKDIDADDVEFVFFGNFSPKTLIPHFVKHEFSEFISYHNIYKIPLYDLFCNWKFHLL